MFEVITKNNHYKEVGYEKRKRIEAMCRGQRESYTVIYPDGAILECKFNNENKN